MDKFMYLYFLASIAFLFFIFIMIKRFHLELRYSLLWIFLAFVFIALSICPQLLILGKWFFGIETPVNSLFLIVIGIQLLLIFMLTLVLSRISAKQRAMAQSLAISNINIDYYKRSDVLVIIPAYNEAKAIKAVVTDIRTHTDYDVVVVNDCSTDLTYNVCIENGIPVLNLPVNLGIGGAVQTGYKFATQKAYTVAIQFDGDGQHNALFLPLLIEQIINGNNMVIGSRFLSPDYNDGTFYSTTLRRFGIKYFKGLIKFLTGVVITDATSGMRAIDSSILHEFSKSYPSDYPEPESLVKSITKKYRVTEVSVKMNARKEGKSSINALKSIYYMIKVSLAILLARIDSIKND